MKNKQIRAILFIAIGILILLNPSEALVIITSYLGILLLLTGVLSVYTVYRNSKHRAIPAREWTESVMIIVFALIILIYPQKTINILVIIIGLGALVTGIFQLKAYIKLKNNGVLSYPLLSISILSLIISFILIVHPFGTFKLLMILIGCYLLITGILYLIDK